MSREPLTIAFVYSFHFVDTVLLSILVEMAIELFQELKDLYRFANTAPAIVKDAQKVRYNIW